VLSIAFLLLPDTLVHSTLSSTNAKALLLFSTPVTSHHPITPTCQAEEALQEAARVMQERKQREDEERARKEYEMNGWDRTLPVVKFKALWASLATAGSFQCNLKALPAITNLTEHLKKQGELLWEKSCDCFNHSILAAPQFLHYKIDGVVCADRCETAAAVRNLHAR
jgi:hypothetical protein